MEAFNQTLYLWINAASDAPGWQITLARIAAGDVIYLVPAGLAVLWLLGGQARQAAMGALVATVVALAANLLIGALWFHPRPFMIGLGNNFLPHAPDSSFPSDHVTIMLTCAFVLIPAHERLARSLGTLLLIFAVPTAWARIYLGLHWPLDMAGALAIAAVVAWIIRSAAGRWLVAAALAGAEKLYRCLLARPIARGWLRP